MNNHQPFNTVGEEGYLHLLKHILDNGYQANKERTGTGTIVSPTPHQLHFPDVGENFPLFTTKYVSFNMLACEMLWFISGETNANRIEDIGSHAMAAQWLKWADDYGDLGPVYGKQWRNWRDVDVNYTSQDFPMGKNVRIDQLQNVIEGIRENPEGRRHIVSAWNPADIKDMALPPCHLMYQFTCEPISYSQRCRMAGHSPPFPLNKEGMESFLDNARVPKYKLHLHLTQRSCDMFLGVPFNVAEYALLLLMVAKVTNTVPGGFTWTGVNCHIYQNHVDAVKKQLTRDPYKSPKVTIEDLDLDTFVDQKYPEIDEYARENITLHNYRHHPKIEAKVSV